MSGWGGPLLRGAIGLLPVVCFLVALMALDSYKLVRLRVVIGVIVAGVVAAGAAYWCNAGLLAATGFEIDVYARTLAPLVEESLKAVVIVLLVRANRIGFLV